GTPSRRPGRCMVYEEVPGPIIMFGGAPSRDAGTSLVYEPADTWMWNGLRWIERFPAHNPPGRASHVMVYDSANRRILMFGGRRQNVDLNDTWAYANNDWTQITTTDAP